MVARYGTLDNNVEEKGDGNFVDDKNASKNNTRRSALLNYKYILGKHSIDDVAIVKLT